MDRIILLLSLKPILFGLMGMVISGLSFPVAGVIIIRNGLIPMRYMLMHGVILGGIVSIALNIPLLYAVIPINILLVLLITIVNRRGFELSNASTALMVFSMGLASLLCHVFDVPAKDTLELLWGSPFALTSADLIILALTAVLIAVYVVLFFREISILFFDQDIAYSLRVNVDVHKTVMLLFTAVVVSVAMKLIGALLIDALVVLPVLGVSRNARSLKRLFIGSSLLGFVLSVSGYLLSLRFNLPVSGVISVLSTVVFLATIIVEKIPRKEVKR